MEIIALNNATRQNKILKVAAYARVSTLSEEQKTSYDSQVAHFKTLIRSNKRWEFAGIYADQGRSGLKAEKRPQFLQIIEDAKAGKIEIQTSYMIQNIHSKHCKYAKNRDFSA